MNIVYFSSVSGNTHRFVQKLGYKSARIGLYTKDPVLEASEPYVLIVPTYGGGSTRQGAVPKQVIKFLNHKPNRELIRGIVSMGNTNFGTAYCKAGDIISEKTGAPVIGKVEIYGTPEDVRDIQNEIEKLGAQH